MKVLVAIPTLSRADLLIRNKEFLEAIKAPDEVLLLDNGDQVIDIEVPIEHSENNLGVAGSWNFFLRRAFVERDFDGLVLLQDDIIWDMKRLSYAKDLLMFRKDVDLFLAYHQFSIQVHRRENVQTIGYYDERYFPAYCEDDDYAVTMTDLGRVYQRFHELDPLPGSIIEGTPKPPGVEQSRKFVEKWGAKNFRVNALGPWYDTNRNILRKGRL